MTNKIREIREQMGLNQRQLAEQAHICQSLLSDFELDKRKTWPNIRRALAKALNCSEELLFPVSQNGGDKNAE